MPEIRAYLRDHRLAYLCPDCAAKRGFDNPGPARDWATCDQCGATPDDTGPGRVVNHVLWRVRHLGVLRILCSRHYHATYGAHLVEVLDVDCAPGLACEFCNPKG